MTFTIPVWAIWLAFALWPWLLVVLAASLDRPSGGMFDIDIWTPLAVVAACCWTMAVIGSAVLRWAGVA